MKYMEYILPILAVGALSAGWLAIQFLAKKTGTKNHFDDGASGCGNCGCGHACERKHEAAE
ncbi:MAG: hypothetical protein ACE5FF_06050 [Saprospiraceae bacterium]